MKRLIFVLVLFGSAKAAAFQDYSCMTQCNGAGRPYGECQQRCDTSPGPFNFKRQTGPDLRCVAQCQAAGYNPNFCERRCE